MKKIIFALLIAISSMSFAKKETERKPANSSSMGCIGYSYTLGNSGGNVSEFKFGIGFGESSKNNLSIDSTVIVPEASYDEIEKIDNAILSGSEFKVGSNKLKIKLSKQTIGSSSWERGDSVVNHFTLTVNGKKDGGGVCERYNH